MARRRRGGGGDSGGGHSVNRNTPPAEQNIIWKLANGIWRPTRHPDFDAAQAAARRRGQNLPDPRSGQPAHRREGPRTTRQQQQEMADELGYEPTSHRGVQPIFQRRGPGEPQYISYDMDGHGTAIRGPDGRVVPYDPNNPQGTAPEITWKGASNPRDLANRQDRDATYSVTYDDRGNVVWRPFRG